MPLYDLIRESATRFPEKKALVFCEKEISFADLFHQSRQVAARLQRVGIGAGARVAILHENALSAVVFFWGVLGVGAQVVDVPCLSGTDTIAEILAESKPAAFVISRFQLERLTRSRPTWLPPHIFMEAAPQTDLNGNTCHALEEIVSSESSDLPLPRANDCEVALVVYTSGTTGRPKGVMLSHRNLLTNISAANSLVRLNSNDSILLVVPLHFIHGRMQLLTHAMIGGTLALSTGFQFPQRIVDELAKYQVTGFSGVPYHFSTLLERTSLITCSLPHLRYVLITGGAMRPDALRTLAKALPGVAIHLAYGQTEASPRITYLAPCEVLKNPESSGQPLPGVRVDIVDDDGASLPAGMVGEVVASGPNIMCGYVSGDEVGSQKIDSFGRLHTGDFGRLDDEGNLYVVGRKSDLIKCAGERVFPGEIESVLAAHPAIQESAVFGSPDNIFGEKIVACIVLRTGFALSAEDIRTHCLKSLPLVRVPREIRFSDGLPKTASGKVDRAAVRTQTIPSKLERADILTQLETTPCSQEDLVA